MPRGSRKTILFRLALLALMAGVVETASHTIIRVARPYVAEEIRPTKSIYREQSERIERLLAGQPDRREQHDPELGWRYRPGFEGSADHINRQGLRSLHDYAPEPPPGVVRLAAFGNSFVYCNEVGDADAWPALLEGDGDSLEVLNYGVGGYGTDQAMLRFRREGMDLSPQVVLIGFAPVNLRRIVNVYRRFVHTSEGIMTKPRFVRSGDGQLTLVPNPIREPSDWERYLKDPSLIRELGRNDQWYEPAIYRNPFYDLSATVRLASVAWIRISNRYLRADRLLKDGLFNEESEAFRLQLAVLKAFVADVEDAGATPFVLILPDRESIERRRRGEEAVFEPLLRALRASGLEVLDATEGFGAPAPAGGVGRWFAPGGHYSPDGNRAVASWLGERIRSSIRGGSG